MKKTSLWQKLCNSLNTARHAVHVSLFFSCIIILWCNSFAIFKIFKRYIASEGVVYGLSYALAITLCAVLALFIIFSISLISQQILRFVVVLCMLVATVYNYYVYKINLVFSESVLESMILSNANDLQGAYDHDMIFFIFIFFCVPMIILYHIKIKSGSVTGNILSFCKIAGLLLVSIVTINHNVLKLQILSGARNSIMPFPLICATPDLKRRTKHALMLRFGYAKDDYYDDYGDISFKRKTIKKPTIAILLVGESLRSNRLSVNGYNRDTTPFMNNAKNLFAFKDVQTCGVVTSDSVPCMLTDVKQDEFMLHKENAKRRTSLASIVTKVGFESTWYNMQYRVSMENYGKTFAHTQHYISHDQMIAMMALTKNNDYNDMMALHFIDTNVAKDTLYVVHMRGSHRMYNKKYTREYAKFQPDLGLSDVEQSNAYDNTVYYFDQFMKQLVDKVKDKNAFIFYVSDHGESLGEGGYRYHGCCANVDDAPPEQRNVPMIVWMSDKFIATNVAKFNAIKRVHNMQNKIKLRHDHVFHSFLDCLNIESEIIDKKQSICSSSILLH